MYREKFGNVSNIVKIISDLQKLQKNNGKWNSGESSTNFRSNMFSYVVKLAPESPGNKSYDIFNHDESSYDSFHNWETGKYFLKK